MLSLAADKMHIFQTVAQSVAALLGIGILGFWIIKRRIIPENVLGFLSTLAIDIALPCVVFASIVLNFSPSTFPDWWQLPPWWFAFAFVTLLLTFLASFISQKGTRSEFAITLFFQNAIFFPLIVINGIFGKETPLIAQLFIFIILHPSLYFATYHLFFRQRAGEARPQLNLRRIVNPVLVATLVAMIVSLLGIQDNLPEFVMSIFQMLGAMTLPLLMIILGGSLYLDFQQKGHIYIGEIIKFVLIKNFAFPLVFLGLLLLIRPDYNLALMIILQSAVPPITAIPVATEREGGNRAITSQFILASFVISIISIPMVFNLFSRFFPMP